MSNSDILGVKCFCIVTGASRGIGRATAVSLASKFGPDSVMVITGRSAPKLSESEREVAAAAPGVRCRSVIGDLQSSKGELSSIYEELTKDADPADFQHALLINNAGSIGDVSRFASQFDFSDYDSLQEYHSLNVTSTMLLTSHFLRVFATGGVRRTVVNVSSNVGILYPLSGMSVYAMSKAARHMLFKVIATEEPDARILNYSPGSVDTGMYTDFRKVVGQDARDWIAMMDEKKAFLRPDQTASMLTRILEDDTYESGEQLEYYQYEKSLKNNNKIIN